MRSAKSFCAAQWMLTNLWGSLHRSGCPHTSETWPRWRMALPCSLPATAEMWQRNLAFRLPVSRLSVGSRGSFASHWFRVSRSAHSVSGSTLVHCSQRECCSVPLRSVRRSCFISRTSSSFLSLVLWLGVCWLHWLFKPHFGLLIYFLLLISHLWVVPFIFNNYIFRLF